MSQLRKVEKITKKYEWMLLYNVEEAKKNKDQYKKDVDYLVEYLEVYINSITEEFKMWCNLSVQIFFKPENNIIELAKKRFFMAVANHYLNKLSGEMFEAPRLQKALKRMSTRFNQFQYFNN